MKRIRLLMGKPWVVAMLVISFLNLACNAERIEQPNHVKMKDYSGEELFKSIIFMDGEATYLFPVLTEYYDVAENLKNKKDIESFKKAQIDAINFLKGQDPNFFHDFKEDLYSKDPYVIQEAIRAAAKNLTPFFAQQMKGQNLNFDYDLNNKDEVKKLKSDLDQYISLNKDNKAEEETIVLAYAVAVVLAIFFYVVAVSEFEIGVIQQGEDQLLMEELSLSVSEEL